MKLKDILTEGNISYKNDVTKKKAIGIGAHFVFSGRMKIGVFHIRKIGTIPFDPMNWIGMKGKGKSNPNSIFMFGGMAIMLSGQGIGKDLIKTIFKDNPNIKHIMLYTTDSALGFWKKVGGKILGEKSGNYYMRIDKK